MPYSRLSTEKTRKPGIGNTVSNVPSLLDLSSFHGDGSGGTGVGGLDLEIFFVTHCVVVVVVVVGTLKGRSDERNIMCQRRRSTTTPQAMDGFTRSCRGHTQPGGSDGFGLC